MKKKILPLFISIIIHLFFVLVFIIIYMNFNNQTSFTQQKVSIQLNNITTYSKADIEPKIEQNIKKTVKTKEIEQIKPKIKEIKKQKEFIKIDEDIQPQKYEPDNKVLPIPTVEDKSIKDEKKIYTKKIKEIDVAKQYVDNNKELIIQLLKNNLYYPRSARKRGITGEILVKFILSKAALVHSLEIISSKSDILSRGALKTINSLSGKFPAPKEEITLIVPINYSLN